MKNKLFIISLLLVLSLPINVWAVDNSSVENDKLPVLVNTLDEDIDEPINVVKINNDYKQPISKRKIAMKFLAAMSGVAISSLAIFILLSIYNKLRERFGEPSISTDDEVSLESPQDFNSAIKSFLDKTNWK